MSDELSPISGVRQHLRSVAGRISDDVLPPHYPTCLGCGPEAEQGYHLQVRREGDEMVAEHVFETRHSGAPGIAHGGAVATVVDDVLGFIKVRLSSLRLGTTGRFLEGGHQLDFGTLLSTNAVLEIEDVGDDSDKAFLMGTVLIRLAEHLRMASRAGPAGSPGLRHLTVIEEAHRLLRRQETGAPAGAAASDETPRI